MTKSIPELWNVQDAAGSRRASADSNERARLAELRAAFAAATGWPLKIAAADESSQDPDLTWSAPVDPGVGIAPGHVRLGLGLPQPAGGDAAAHRCDDKSARKLAAAIESLLNRLGDARRAIRQREAELAAGVPVVVRADESELLAERLEGVLRAGAQACECQAAALYMLDETTAFLKLRASWGLPIERLLQPPRPLEGAIADLEALLGHAVALERAADYGPWRVPEEFAAALCVPVSTPTVPLGTLWFFSDRPREFTDTQTGLAELVSGRLAAELERTMLLEMLRQQRPNKSKSEF